jgi:hypothetical protein
MAQTKQRYNVHQQDSLGTTPSLVTQQKRKNIIVGYENSIQQV